MEAVMNATNVRREWSQFFDGVVHSQPAFVRRNRDYLVALSLEHLQLVLSIYRFHMEYEQEEDGTYSGSLAEIDVVGNAASKDALKRILAEDLVEYAKQYMREYQLYFHSLNRREHFPYILLVLAQDDISSVEKLIDA
jgi:hypothetical protein